jgi:hypothetical protein
MKTINTTTTGQLFNELGVLSHAGEYAGEYQDEAAVIIGELQDVEFENNAWADIMHNYNGVCYAIFAKDAITCHNEMCLYVKIDRSDCPKAYDNAQTHI